MKLAAVGLFCQSIFFIHQMIGILQKRFKEISDRKLKKIKIQWFVPLNKQELEILGIKPQKNEKHIL